MLELREPNLMKEQGQLIREKNFKFGHKGAALAPIGIESSLSPLGQRAIGALLNNNEHNFSN